MSLFSVLSHPPTLIDLHLAWRSTWGQGCCPGRHSNEKPAPLSPPSPTAGLIAQGQLTAANEVEDSGIQAALLSLLPELPV